MPSDPLKVLNGRKLPANKTGDNIEKKKLKEKNNSF